MQDKRQQVRLRRIGEKIRVTHPLLVCLSRVAYLALALIIYSVLSTLWIEKEVNETLSLSQLQNHLKNAVQEDIQSVSHPDLPRVAFVVVISSCNGHKGIPFEIIEGAAVLKYSIQENVENFEMVAFYHPDAKECSNTLQELGYSVQERPTPVAIEDMQGSVIRERIAKNGCCGEKELIKLEAFTLTDYDVVVLLDLDVLVLKPMHRLFDFILNPQITPDRDDLLRPEAVIPNRIDLLYTTDYAMVGPERKIKPTQGGFVILRPNRTVYDDFIAIVKKGDFREDGGWGGKTGKFWGAMTFQGLIPYYFQVLNPGRAVELNWCVWNNMCSPSRDKGVDKEKDEPIGNCFTQQDNCEDCRNRPVADVALTHFTVCQKPWTCNSHNSAAITSRLCRDLTHKWFEARSSMEKSWGRSGRGSSGYDREHFNGYCKSFGKIGYEVIKKPYGLPLGLT